jgi:Cys-rich protein (TIGR01571 family)
MMARPGSLRRAIVVQGPHGTRYVIRTTPARRFTAAPPPAPLPPLPPPELIMAQEVPANAPHEPPVPWTQSLCGCNQQSFICAEEVWCCYCHLGFVYDYLTTGRRGMSKKFCLLPALADPFCCGTARCTAIYQLRSLVKHRYNIDESARSTCAKSFCCSWCAMCQMHRELHSRQEYTGGIYYMGPSVYCVPMGTTPPPPAIHELQATKAKAQEKIPLQAKTFKQLGLYVSGQPQDLPQYGYDEDNCTGYPERYAMSAPSVEDPANCSAAAAEDRSLAGG